MSHWDILVLTARDDAQASTYRAALSRRRELRNIDHVRHSLVVPAPDGKDIGSAGFTIQVLAETANLLLNEHASKSPVSKDLSKIFAGKRVLVIHAADDSCQLPAYSSVGKVLLPLPGAHASIEPLTLLDRLLELYLELPGPADDSGQVVIASADQLPDFDARELSLSGNLVGSAVPVAPSQAADHAVFLPAADGAVARLLQKPDESVQRAEGAIDPHGNSLLDIGLFSFDHAFAAVLLDLAGYAPLKAKAKRGIGTSKTATPTAKAIAESGLDFHRDICSACGSDASYEFYEAQVRAAGSALAEKTLRLIYDALRSSQFRVAVAADGRLFRFGNSREIIWSGAWLMRRGGDPDARVIVNSEITGTVTGGPAWIEGCQLSDVEFGGDNLLVGVQSEKPLSLAAGIALDLLPLADGLALRVYGVHDTFEADSSYCNEPVADWLKSMAAKPADVWEKGADKTLANARIFPVIADHAELHKWIWLQQPKKTKLRQAAWKKARRVSAAELAEIADRAAFVAHRRAIHRQQLRTTQLPTIAVANSAFSAVDLGVWLAEDAAPADVVRVLLERAQACGSQAREAGKPQAALEGARILHSMASAAERLPKQHELATALAFDDFRSWSFGLVSDAVTAGMPVAEIAKPEFALSKQEMVWARSPVRIDLAGAWTDTPPHTLEEGGCVVSAAITLSGQQPVQVYVRRTGSPRIRISSIDHGHRITVERLDDLMNFQKPDSDFAVVKAALALVGFAPNDTRWRGRPSLRRMLEQAGGGLEITMLCAAPEGSGLGSGRILGATVLAALLRTLGQEPGPHERFQLGMRLAQMLSNGSGWQDPVGALYPGVKLAVSKPGFAPDPQPSFLDPELICPTRNGARTLLYYTGITRKNNESVQQVTGRVLDRDRAALRTLAAVRKSAKRMSAAISQKDHERFGAGISEAWRLNKDLDPESSTREIEAILSSIEPHILGAKPAGAGGGGFLFIVCADDESVAKVRRELERHPANDRARFFDFAVSETGLEVTTC
ncbi:MAG: fucokinase [Rhodothermales bacterium]|jgi:fucokinase